LSFPTIGCKKRQVIVIVEATRTGKMGDRKVLLW
jgi:hypothetical protein